MTPQTAEEQALALARRHGISLTALASKLLNDLCAGVPADMADTLTALYQATQRLLERQAAAA